MNRWHFLMILLALPAIMLPQNAASQYPNRERQSALSAGRAGAIHRQSLAAGGGYSGGGTVAGNAMNGMANVISAQGQRNLSNSAAAINMTQARSNEIQNRQLWTNTYFDMRDTNRQAVAAERGPNLTQEQLARIAKDGVPRPLAPNQMDPVTGQLNWPSALQQDCFASQRNGDGPLFAMRARYGGLDYANQMQARQTVDDMFHQLKAQIDQIPQQDYMDCRSFLQRLMYAATRTELS